jgi:ankyrin repeat protein
MNAAYCVVAGSGTEVEVEVETTDASPSVSEASEDASMIVSWGLEHSGHAGFGDDGCPCKYLDIHYTVWAAAQLVPEVTGLQELMKIERKNPERLLKLDSYGYSALHYSAQRNHVRKMKVILKHLKNPDLNGCGATPLHRAAFSGSYEACELLLVAGANPNLPDSSMSGAITPIQKAKMNGHHKIVDLLLRYDAEDKNLPLGKDDDPCSPNFQSDNPVGSAFGSGDGEYANNNDKIYTSESASNKANNTGESISNNTSNNSNNCKSNVSNARSPSGVLCDECKQPTFAVYRRRRDRQEVCAACRYL